MTTTVIHKIFFPIKKVFPTWISDPLRSFFTAILTPVYFSFKSGHFKSSFRRAAIDKQGNALPWYTYPCIDFLKRQSYEGKTVLEFGGGQSTLWWAGKVNKIITFENNKSWYQILKETIPKNCDLHFVENQSSQSCVNEIESIIAQSGHEKFDVIIIDGLCRSAIIPLASQMIADDGVIICDNSEGYGIFQGFAKLDFQRIDFYGHVPGVILPQSTSIYFKNRAFIFNNKFPISVDQ